MVSEGITAAASSTLGSSEHVQDLHAHATHSAKKWIVKPIAIKYFAQLFSLFPKLILTVSTSTGILEHSSFLYRISLEEYPQAILAKPAMVAVSQKNSPM